MIYNINNSDQLNDLYPSFLELAEDDSATSMEINLEPGVYGMASIGQIGLTLEHPDLAKTGRIDVILRSASRDAPAIFNDMFVKIRAKSVKLENIIFSKRTQARGLQFAVLESFEAKNIMMTGNNVFDPRTSALCEIKGLGQKPVTAKLENAWFVKNAKEKAGTLIAFTGGMGSFQEIVFDGAAFVLNEVPFDLGLFTVQNAQIKNSLILETSDQLQHFLNTQSSLGSFQLEGNVVCIPQNSSLVAETHNQLTKLENNQNVVIGSNAELNLENVTAFADAIPTSTIPKVSDYLEQFRTKFEIKP